ncbi:hypothetical protein [Streptomyces sp. NPDC057280]|uniref:hypothetical protein n=1 Tax=Streptomyces sp. NPDC057280 TaxID=3346081 RepID=UPI003630F797
MNHTVSAIDWPVDQPIPYTVTPLALDGIPSPRSACPSWCSAEARIELGGAAALGVMLFNGDDGPSVGVFSDDATGADLDVDGVDQLIEDVEAFLPKLRGMRRRLAKSSRQADETRVPLYGAAAESVRDRLREPSDLDVAARIARRLLADYADVDHGDSFALNQAHGAIREALRILLRAVDVEAGERS